MSRDTLNPAPYGYHPGTKIPRRHKPADEHEGRGVCRACGERGLVWEFNERWRLVDVGGKVHKCKRAEE